MSGIRELRVISEASKPCAVLAVLIPPVFPLIMIWALGASGHTLADYPGLLATGEHSVVRQGIMWIAMALFIAIYVPPALVALRAPQYIATDGLCLLVPSGQKFRLADLESLSVRKIFWHKIMHVRAADADQKIVVTFATELAGGLRSAPKVDPDLANVKIG